MGFLIYFCVCILIFLGICSAIRQGGDDITLVEMIGMGVMSVIPLFNLAVLIWAIVDCLRLDWDKVIIKGRKR